MGQQAATWGELGVEELQELELDSKALLRSGGWEARGRLGLPSRPFLRNVFVRESIMRKFWEEVGDTFMLVSRPIDDLCVGILPIHCSLYSTFMCSQ